MHLNGHTTQINSLQSIRHKNVNKHGFQWKSDRKNTLADRMSTALPRQDRLNGGAPGAWQCRCRATATMLSHLLPQMVTGFLLAHPSVPSQTHWRTVGDPSFLPYVTSPFVFHPVDRVELVELPDRLFRLIKSPRNLSPVSRLLSAFLLSNYHRSVLRSPFFVNHNPTSNPKPSSPRASTFVLALNLAIDLPAPR
jgi:hypothetical protein